MEATDIATETPELSAIEIQRRLELKEFFLSKNDSISAALVDNMFTLAGFERVKEQVLQMYNELPENWTEKDRYGKYKRLLEQGVTPTRIRKEMATDGIDPEEFGWDDESSREAKIRLSRMTGRQSITMGRKKSSYGNTLFRKKNPKKKQRKTSLIELGMEQYEMQAELGKLRCQSTFSRSTEDDFNSLRKNPLKGLRKQMGKKKRPLSSKRRQDSAQRPSREADLESLSDVSLDSIDMVDLDEDDYRNNFRFSKSDAEEDNSGERKKSVFGTLTNKNKVGRIHDYMPYFRKAPEKMLRKSSVGNMKRRMTGTSNGRKSRLGSVFYEDDGRDLKLHPDDKDRKPPEAPPRKRRTTVYGNSAKKDL